MSRGRALSTPLPRARESQGGGALAALSLSLYLPPSLSLFRSPPAAPPALRPSILAHRLPPSLLRLALAQLHRRCRCSSPAPGTIGAGRCGTPIAAGRPPLLEPNRPRRRSRHRLLVSYRLSFQRGRKCLEVVCSADLGEERRAGERSRCRAPSMTPSVGGAGPAMRTCLAARLRIAAWR